MAEVIDVHAFARHIPVSSQKVRRVVDLIRGRQVDEALDILRFTTSSASAPLSKVLTSAIANAEENFGMNRGALVLHKAYADEGPTRRWRRFGARGRFKPILRRTSHIVIVLREREAAAASE